MNEYKKAVIKCIYFEQKDILTQSLESSEVFVEPGSDWGNKEDEK